jgi:hypothetical protein
MPPASPSTRNAGLLGDMGSSIPPGLRSITAEQAGLISYQRQLLRAGFPRRTCD